MLFQLVIIVAGYIIGLALIFILKLIGIAFAISNAVLILLILPIICACIAEAVTLFWTHTPGSLGLGGLIVFIPMVIAGLVNVAAALAAQKWLMPLDLGNSIRSSEHSTGWFVMIIICCVISLSLWRFWPTPTAKLW